jgi:hypothetical protein
MENARVRLFAQRTRDICPTFAVKSILVDEDPQGAVGQAAGLADRRVNQELRAVLTPLTQGTA